jgi:phosphoadenosine phosphosulfate reductase
MAYEGAEQRDIVSELDASLRDAQPQEILRVALETYGDKLALVSSFGAESAVLLHMAAQLDPNIAVLFLDTGMLFGQTLDYRKQLAAQLGLTGVRDLRPQYSDLAINDPNANLWKTDTDACCEIRKVLPLDRALGEFDAWITGRKRFHGGDRLRLPVVERGKDGKVKFNPLANWSKADLDAYVLTHGRKASPRSAAGPAPRPWKLAGTSAPAAGRAPTRANAAFTWNARRRTSNSKSAAIYS